MVEHHGPAIVNGAPELTIGHVSNGSERVVAPQGTMALLLMDGRVCVSSLTCGTARLS